MDFVRPARPIVMSLVSGKGHYDTVLRAVRDAKHSVWIATANLKELMIEDDRWSVRRKRANAYRSVIDVFAEKVTQGVHMRVLHASLPSRAFRAELLRQPALTRSTGQPALTTSIGKPGRFEIRSCLRVHLKAVVVDGEFLYLGSANWTGAGLGAKGTGRRNFELGFVTDDALLLDDVQELFDRIWRGAECGACKLREICKAPLDQVERTERAGRLERAGQLAQKRATSRVGQRA